MSAFRLSCLAVMVATSACAYDPPPAVRVSTPANGSVIGDYSTDIVVGFTEAIRLGTLQITLSTRKLDAEGNLLSWCETGHLEDCNRLLAGPCDSGSCTGAILTLHAGGTGFRLDPDKDINVDEYVLRISAGLSDLEGNQTGQPIDIRFFVSPTGQLEPTTFQSGVLFTLMNLKQPFEFPFEVYWHVRVNPDTGEIHGGGCDSDLIDPDDLRHLDPAIWKPNPAFADGFKFVFSGVVQDVLLVDEQGQERQGYYLETKPFYIYCDSPMVEVVGGYISTTIYHDELTGRDVMKGSMRSNEVYIFDTPAHSSPYVAIGDVDGLRLFADEIQEGDEWTRCASEDPATVTLPPSP